MATQENRLIELTLKLQAAQAEGVLQDMADSAKELKTALLGASQEAKGFSQATTALASAKGELKEFNLIARGITFDQQIASTVKFANGFVGGITAMKGAMALFGNASSEEMKKVEEKMVSAIGVMKGLDEVARAFSAKNIAGIKALWQSFQTLSETVKIAGVTMKTALISTGIGALIVGLGLLIANWDAVTAALKRNYEAKKMAEDLENLNKEIEIQKKIVEELNKEYEAQKKINDLKDNKKANDDAEVKNLADKNVLLNKEIEAAKITIALSKSKIEDAQKDYDRADKHFENAIKHGVTFLTLMGMNVGILAKEAMKKQEILDLAIKEKEQAQATLDADQKQLELNGDLSAIAKTRAALEEQISKNKEAQVDLEDKIKILQATGNRTIEIFQTQRELIKLKEREIVLQTAIAGVVTEENKLKLKELATDMVAIDIKEKNFKKELDYRNSITNIETAYGKENQRITEKMKDQTLELNKQEAALKKRNELNQVYANLFDITLKGLYDYEDIQNQSLEIGMKRVAQIREEYETVQLIPSKLSVTTEAYQKIVGLIKEANLQGSEQFKTVEDYGNALQKNITIAESDLKIGAGVKDTNSYIFQQKVKEMAVLKTISDVQKDILYTHEKQDEEQVNSLGNEISLLTDKQAALATEKEDLEIQKAKLEVEYKNAKNVEEKTMYGDKILALETKINSVKNEQQTADNDVLQSQIKQSDLITDINKTSGEITENTSKTANEHQRIVGEMTIEEGKLQKLANWYGKNAKLIDAGNKLMHSGLDAIMVAADNNVKKRQHELDAWEAANKNAWDAAKKAADDAKKDYDNFINSQKTKEDELNTLRADADASRLGAIDQEIAQLAVVAAKKKKDAQTAADAQYKFQKAEVDMRNALADAQYKQQLTQKRINVVMAVMDTALAVVKAAPNPILMIAAGVVGAAAAATIAAQQVPKAVHEAYPPAPKLAEGGMLEGNSHAQGGIPIEAEGGEWIAPKWMTENPRTAPVIDSLEQIRQSKPKFAQGGSVPSGVPASPATQSMSIDYDKLAQALQSSPIYVSIKEIRDTNRRFANIVYDRSSI